MDASLYDPAPALHHAWVISDDDVLLTGPVSFALSNDSTLKLGGEPVSKPYKGLLLDGTDRQYYLIKLHQPGLGKLDSLHPLTLDERGKEIPLPEHRLQRDGASALSRFSERLPNTQREKLFFFLAEQLNNNPRFSRSPLLCAWVQSLRAQLQGPKLTLVHGSWLAEHILYVEAMVHGYWPEANPRTALSASGRFQLGRASLFQIDHTHVAGIVLFDDDACPAQHDPCSLAFFSHDACLTLSGSISDKAFSLEFIAHLAGKPTFQQHLIRESIGKALLMGNQSIHLAANRELLRKLQYFLPQMPETRHDPALPFAIHFEQVVTIAPDTLFTCGWLRDPYDLLEDIEAVSALGFSFSLMQNFYRYARPDVHDSFKDTAYGEFQEENGFTAYAAAPAEWKQKMDGLAELHAVRFTVRLRGGIVMAVTPEIKHRDSFTARDLIVRLMPSSAVSNAMLENCIAPAIAKLQALCMREVAVDTVTTIGVPVRKAEISLVIPLYKRLDFIKVQMAQFALDGLVKASEIIYVLDSPEQAGEAKCLLEDLYSLYCVPATLLVMKRNSGYAAATNAGAHHARGKLLVLMNSDILPKSPAWLATMAAFYAKTPDIGALAPKLLYEDDSIQHAGMYFAQGSYPFWLNRHYHKGFPRSFKPAAKSRPVPAVTAACLMIDRSLYEKIGLLSTDYVIGDFEDSDLCLKCHAEGLHNWYLAEVEMYHIERQSVPLNPGYHESLAWRYNGRLHSRRWDSTILSLMQLHKAA